MARLVVKKGEHAGQVFELQDREYLIGRGNQCDIQIKDGSVSRTHAAIFHDKSGEFFVRDNGSTYGTIVDGIKIKEAVLADKAIIQLGGVALEFLRETSQYDDHVPGHSDFAEPGENSYTILHTLKDETKEEEGRTVDRRARSVMGDIHDVQQARERLRLTYEISEMISQAIELDELYKRILEAIFNTTKVERASILLVDEHSGEIKRLASLDKNGSAQEIPYSRTIVNKVIHKGESLLLSNAQADGSFGSSQSIFMHDIRSAMCVPISTREKIIGAIVADASGISVFSKDDLRLLSLIGNQAGTVIQNARLIEENIQAERLAAVGQTVASLAHCIKNILQGLKGGSFMMDEGLKNTNAMMIETAWPMVKGSQQRITELVMNMLDYSKERKPAYSFSDLREHMENIYALMTDRAKEKNIKITLDYDPETPKLDCDAMGIYRATLNLVTNAIDAVEPDVGEVTIKVRPSMSKAHILISVIDNGEGIPDEVKDKLFQAFQSTKDSKGTGLGLAVSHKIVHEHRGDIQVNTKVGAGTTFTIQLPVHKPAE